MVEGGVIRFSFKRTLCQLGLVLLFFSSVSPVCWAGVKVFPSHVMLGEPVTLIITGNNIEKDFEKIDKDTIRKAFEIWDVEGDADRLRLKIYPRKVGEIGFPAMKQGSIDFNGQIISVAENPEVAISWTVPKNNAFVGQGLLWAARVKLANSANAAILEAHAHANKKVDRVLSPKPVLEETGMFGKDLLLMMRVSSETKGRVRFRSPVVKVKNTTNRAWLFFADTQWVDLKPLPNYMPRNIPIGRLQIESDEMPFIHQVGSLQHWKLNLKGQQQLPDNLPSIDAQLGYSEDVEWVPTSVKKSVFWNEQGMFGEQEIAQAFRVNKIGFYALPSLRLTYFDPVKMRLEDVFIESQTGLALPSWVKPLTEIFAFMWVGIFVLIGLRFASVYQKKRQLVLAIQKAKSVEEVWLAMQLWLKRNMVSDQAQSVQSNESNQNNDYAGHQFTIGQWQTHVEKLNVSREALFQRKKNSYSDTELFGLLNQHFFQADVELNKIKRVALAWAENLNLLQLFFSEFRIIKNFFKAMIKA